MADTLRIKRRAVGGAAGAPASLAAAEIAYNEQDDTLYYGKGNSGGAATTIVPIAGPGAFQAKDGDLTSLAAASAVGVIYYRSAADTWGPITIGSGLSFTSGTLSAAGGGGDVFKAGANTFTAQNCFTNKGVVIGNTTASSTQGLELHGSSGNVDGVVQQAFWANSGSVGAIHYFDKSRGTTVGTHVVVQNGDILGDIIFRGSSGSSFFNASVDIRAIVAGVPSGLNIPGAMQIYTANAAGTAVLAANFAPTFCNFIGSTVAAPAGYVGEYASFASSNNIGLTPGAYTNCLAVAIPAGDWDVRGIARVTGTAGQYMYMNVYSLAGSSSGDPDSTQTGIFTALNDVWTSVGPFRVLLTSQTTYYLNIYVPGGGYTLVTGSIQLRRRH